MALSAEAYRKKMAALFPTVIWYGESAGDENPEPVAPISLEQFLLRIREEFPDVPHKELFISFSRFQLSVTRMTKSARKKAAALNKENTCILSSPNLTWRIHEELRQIATLFSYSKGETVQVGELVGNIIERALSKLPKDHKFPVHKGETFVSVSIPEQAHNKVLTLARRHGVSKSTVIHELLLRGMPEAREMATALSAGG